MSVNDDLGNQLQMDLKPAPEFVRLFATPRVVCPEGFVRVHADPGKAFAWSTHYRFAHQSE